MLRLDEELDDGAGNPTMVLACGPTREDHEFSWSSILAEFSESMGVWSDPLSSYCLRVQEASS